MSIEVISSQTQYEAFLHLVNDNGALLSEDYCPISRPDIEAVKEITPSSLIPEYIAWVNLSERAVVRIRHNANPDLAEVDAPSPYMMMPEYPEETLYGNRMLQKETWLATDRADNEIQFTPVSEIIETQKLSPYARRWLGALASGNYTPSFLRKIDNLLTGEKESSFVRISRELGL